MAVERHERDPNHQKPLICVMDGERSLWKLQKEWFPRAIGILDLFHAMERLLEVASCRHDEGSPEEADFGITPTTWPRTSSSRAWQG
jgi:hypothetical protein